MTEAKFTPGPWKVEDGEGKILAGEDNDFSVIGGCGCCGSPWVNGENYDGTDNARLIAAAPELYEALQMLSNICYGTFAEGGTPHKAAIAALAKARGEVA